jgi:hypothetical protein
MSRPESTLPPGFILDRPPLDGGALPPGFTLDRPQAGSQPVASSPQVDMGALLPGFVLDPRPAGMPGVAPELQGGIPGLPPGFTLDSPTATGAQRFPGRTEEPETSKVEKVIQILDYLGGKGRGLIRGAVGGDISDTASFGREFSDPEGALGFLAPGGGLIPEIEEGQSRWTSVPMQVPSFTLGLAADILSDPLTYVTMGTAGAARAAGTRAARLAAAKTTRKAVMTPPSPQAFGDKVTQTVVEAMKLTAAERKQIDRLKRIAEQGGVMKFMGMPIPGTRAAGQALGRATEKTIPARRWLGESKYGAPIREMFTTAPLAGSSQALREVYEQGKGVRFLTQKEKRAAMSQAQDLQDLQRSVYTAHTDIAPEDINRILTDAVERKPATEITPEGAFTFPEALADDIGVPEVQRLQMGRTAILEDTNAQELVRKVRKIQTDILEKERKAGVQTGTFGGRRQRIIDAELKEIDDQALKGTKLRNAQARIARQRELALTDPDYIMHGYTEQAMQAFAKFNKDIFKGIPQGAKQFSTEHASQISRKLARDAENYPTIAQFNAAGRKGELEAFQKQQLDFDVFETDPVRLSIEREMRGIPKIENAKFLNQVGEKYGRTANDLLADPHFLDKSKDYGWIRTQNPETNEVGILWKSNTAKGKKGEDLYFQREVRDHLDITHKTANDPDAVGMVWKIFDDFQGWWKGKTLAMFPAYHVRNVMGNIWNNYLGGVKSYEPYIRAREIQKGMTGTITTRGGGQYSYDEIRRLAKELGVENQGWYSADIERKLQGIDVDDMGMRELLSEANARGWRGLGMLNPLSASGDDLLNIAGRRGGKYLENNARYTQFIHKLREGFSPEEAAGEVMKYLFDYGDTTRVAQKTLGRIFPFFRWTRFNLPLQVEAIAKQPGKFSSLVHAKNVTEADPENPDVEDALLAPFISDAFNIQTRRSQEDGDKAEFFILNNWIPAADLVNLVPERAGEELVRMTTPLLKTLGEQFFNYDLFRDREIERDEGELGEFLGSTMTRRKIHILRNVRFLTELDRLVSSSEFREMMGSSERPQDAGLLENLFRGLTGIKTYGVDVNLSRRIQANLRRQGERGLRSLLVGAQRRGEVDEVERLMKKLRELP